MEQTSKIFVEFATVEERDRAAPVVRSFLEMVFERGLKQAREGTDTPLPELFLQLFGREGLPADVLRGQGAKFNPMSGGGALQAREQVVLDAIKSISKATFTDTKQINDSLIADVGCVLAISNPAVSGLVEKTGPSGGRK